MEIPFNYRSEYLKCLGYTKHIDDSDELCLVCMTDETEEGLQWERYQLQCGHIFHTRCLRRWCYVKKHLNCSYCGDLPEDTTTKYCYIHNVFGLHKGCKSRRRQYIK